ncbi:hypothetical protein KUC52_20275 [Pseudomonas aeruginosa]|uniref:hypothetical protein n=1 Tax=Pseudomonas aeruginosa TaxID=287 RepID=UPI0021E185B4|nr:hypothetical protein [Pseudomonas aeruginosa]MCV0331177.1 hypothetical protein [Pseudomonas aeruginosa]
MDPMTHFLCRTLILIAPVALLAGCAAPLPVMQDRDYSAIGTGWAVGQRCAISGKLDYQTAAAGELMLRQRAAGFSYDTARLQAVANEVGRTIDSNGGIPDEFCRQYGYEIAKEQANRQQAAANSAYQQQQLNQALETIKQSAPKTTYCNRYGVQVQCTTY